MGPMAILNQQRPPWQGKARPGAAGSGTAGRGMGPMAILNQLGAAGHGMARSGSAGHGKVWQGAYGHFQINLTRRGAARQGGVRHGGAWHGKAWGQWPF
jgi:hypothetical protein